MSQRTYTGPSPSARPSAVLVGLGWFLVVATIALQIAFPLVDDEPQQADLAAITVVVFFLASLVHATAYHRWRGFLVVGLVVPVLGWVAERVGYATGYPFGDYSYEATARATGRRRPRRRPSCLGDDGVPGLRRRVHFGDARALARPGCYGLVAHGMGLLPGSDDGRTGRLVVEHH